jgi:hypothetical protein
LSHEKQIPQLRWIIRKRTIHFARNDKIDYVSESARVKLVPFPERGLRLRFCSRGEFHFAVGDVDGVLDLLTAVLLANLLSFFLHE